MLCLRHVRFMCASVCTSDACSVCPYISLTFCKEGFMTSSSIDPLCPLRECNFPCRCRPIPATTQICSSCNQPLSVGQHLLPREGLLVSVCRGCWLCHQLLSQLGRSPPGSQARGLIEVSLNSTFEAMCEEAAFQAVQRAWQPVANNINV